MVIAYITIFLVLLKLELNFMIKIINNVDLLV